MGVVQGFPGSHSGACRVCYVTGWGGGVGGCPHGRAEKGGAGMVMSIMGSTEKK